MFGSLGKNKVLSMKKYKVSIKSSSSYLPPKVVTNFDIAEKIDTSDEWIYKKLGIKERRIAENESVSEMGYKAAISAIFINLLGKRKRTIAEHEAQTAYNAGVYFASKQIGATTKTWISSKDNKVRSEHRLLDGKSISVNDVFDINGLQIRFPGDPLSPPQMTVNCRCRLGFNLD